MNRRLILIVVIGLLLTLSLIILYFARSFILRLPFNPSPYHLNEIITELKSPVYVTHAGDGSGRLFIVEQDGYIQIAQNGAVQEKPFLDVRSLVTREGLEQGLLGLAFHPNYAENGQFFIYYTAVDGKNTVAEYRVSAGNPDRAETGSAQILLAIDDPYGNHNAGQLAFGPDGYLYVGTGDGGSAGDPHGNGQNGHALLGKMLRLDVDNGTPYRIPPDNPFVGNNDFMPEIWAYGLRNPWRFSFDRETGDLYIGDVGQGNWEEIDFHPATSRGGDNYGWNILEGTHPYSGVLVSVGLIQPIAEYSHEDGCSVTGGYVYRGEMLPGLRGWYLFGDWCSGIIWTTRPDDAGNWHTAWLMNTGKMISSFGEDEAGELYVVDYTGSILSLHSAG
jgi:glucose/arabinose dehydrogenase